MLSPQIQDFISIIKHGSNVNTYKLAWGRAILDICTEEPDVELITLERIALKVYKYYWNQTIYFDLIQGNNPNKRAEFLTVIRNDIQKYYDESGTKQPIHFERVEDKLTINVKKLVRILKTDVSWRFLLLDGEKKGVYQYEKDDNELIIKNAHDFKTYNSMLSDVINFKWTQALESFNNAPRIAKKVRVIDFPELKRKSLNPFKKYLDYENPEHTCFICGGKVEKKELAIDHVIPWSSMYSDDLWNLVYVHQSCNSSKSNMIPDEAEIEKLEKRNQVLLDNLKEKNKVYHELETAINSDYVRKFWVGCS